LEYSLPFNILFGIALPPILSTCPNHLILCGLINLRSYLNGKVAAPGLENRD
jgi:hypothetical protein